jgi:PKD repeat protein
MMFKIFKELGNLAGKLSFLVKWGVVLFLYSVTVQAGQVTLAWDANTEPMLGGYKVYYGQASGNYTSDIDVGNQTTYTVAGLQDVGTYYFAVKAYDSARTIESGFSNEVSKTFGSSTAPTANFSASPTSGTTPLTVTFTNTSTGTVSGWSWNFGDGGTSTIQNPAHTYTSAGTYTVSLTAIGPGGSNTATKTNYISVTAAPPVANFSASPTSGTAPLLVNFTDTSTGSVTGWSWNFGDGTTSTAKTAIKTYSNPGTYTVKLTVSGPGGSNTATKTNYISVTAAPPVANFSASPTSGTAPLTVNFSDTSTGTVTGWSWSFGDGGTSTTQNPAHTYTATGTYTVSLTANGPAGTNTKTQTGYVKVSTVASSLVAAYNFEEASGSVVVDASGKGNHGTISGAKRTSSGKYGKALVFDGVDDWVTINDSASLDLNTGMTLEAWVYPTATMSGWRTVILKEDSGSGVYYLYANSGTNQPAGIVETSDNGEQMTSGRTPLSVNKWTHLAVTYNGQYQRLYVNGVEVAAQPQTGAIVNYSNGVLRIGGTSIWNEFFKGRIDEIRIYNRALSASEVQSDMNKSVATSSPPKRLLGEEALGSVSDSLAQGTATAFQTTASVTGQITSLPIYVDSGSVSTKLVGGLYADSNSRPGARLATGTLSSPKAGSWNTVLLPATKVTAGMKYWIAILSTSGTLKFRDKVGSIARPSETSLSTSLTSLPSTWATGTVSGNGLLSGYGAGY